MKAQASKGISPLVAAVLLIAVTMTIAGLLAYWASSFVQTALPAANETEAQCRFADFSIYSCTHFSSTSKLNLILENRRDIELKQLRFYLIFPNGTVSLPTALNETLEGGALKSFSISDVSGNFSKISVKTHCPEIGKEKACTMS